MKYCPNCKARYDDDDLRFCTKDGTLLADEDEPKFIEMPSESLESPADGDPSEDTVIRRGASVPPPPPDDDLDFSSVRPAPQRIVVPTVAEQRPNVAPRVVHYAEREAPNTAKIVFLTVLGTLAVVAVGAALIYLVQPTPTTNVNVNTSMPNLNANLNANLNGNDNIETNFNFNAGTNFNSNTAINTNLNANLKSPTPTPRPTPSPTESPLPTPLASDETPTPTPARTPAPIRTPIPTPQPTVIRPGGQPTPARQPSPSNRSDLSGR